MPLHHQMIGSTLAHYRVLERLGAGGMGTVYRARDERLDRDVAVKVLTPGRPGDDAGARSSEREAQTLARLTHPNIAAVYELGHAADTDFIVMELVPGPSLADRLDSGPLPVPEAIRLGAQIAAALEEAHEHGVIHRDLKPANVRLTGRGDAKVLDFGIARLIESRAGGPDGLPTETATVAGTVPYMSPEQLRGESVDARADIWALGVLTYELLTGKRPFDRATSAETISAILRDAPSPLPASVPPALARVLLRCLEKDAARRYQRASEARAALEATETTGPIAAPADRTASRRNWRAILAGTLIIAACAGAAVWFFGRSRLSPPFAVRGAPHVRSLAVLPLDNMSGDGAQNYFADGITEAITLELSKLKSLQVTSRTSAMRYRKSGRPLPEIARELGVDAIIEGSVIRSGNRARVTVQLIHGATDRHLWAEHYDRDLGDLLAMQSEVARDIAAQIRLELSPVESARLGDARRVNPAAYDAYLRGRQELGRYNREGSERAIAAFRDAIAADASYAPAWAGVAAGYAEMMIWGGAERRALLTQQRAALDRALALDPDLAEVQLQLAQLRSNYDWNWQEAERAFAHAFDLNPNFASAHAAFAYFLQSLGRDDEALVSIHRATRLDPLSPNFIASEGRILYRMRRYTEAVERYQRALQIDPAFQPALSRIIEAYREQRRFDDAAAAVRELERHGADTRRVRVQQALLAAAEGRRAEALRNADGATEDVLALVWCYLGDRDKALEHLNTAVRTRAMFPFQLRDPGLDPIRGDPRFKALLREVGIPD
jgi:TolB-like protein/Tfp pilus assembly protein PilF